MRSIRVIVSIALLSGWASTVLAADQQGHIKLQTVGFQEKVTVAKDGSKHTDTVPADHVLPGTEVIWDVNYEIIGTVSVAGAVITDPVPQNMVYVAGSAAGDDADITFSVDGGKTWGKPETLQVKNADGTLRDAGPKDYTDIRWILKGKLAPGAKGTVSFHATLQ
jgi:uncharacterized repeat protein (TIGR01451 family)